MKEIEEKREIKESINTNETEEAKKISLKEERIRKIAPFYYSRADIRKAIFEFSKNRECVPRYFEGFGKRPDAFQFDSDIIELAKKGATSFHCSEELWSDPLEISTEKKEEQIKNLRIGWDLLLDIDCKYLEYSKKATDAIIRALRKNNVKNIGVKFSGGKGMHIILPFKAFPEEISRKKTKDMFPEWPRLICQYLKEESREFLEKDLYSSEDASILSKLKKGIRCEKCKSTAEKAELITFFCSGCKTRMENLTSSFEKKRKIRCPNCQLEMQELERDSLYTCNRCKMDSRKNPNNFNEAFEHIDIFEVLGLDVILVSPRHLFRMPYSLHEKTALASVVLDADKIKEFEITDANPMKIIPKNFIPNCEEGEAKELLIKAIEFKPPEKKLHETQENLENNKNFGEKKFRDITISNITPELYPPAILKILEGMPGDGKKRALFILLNFFKSLKFSGEQITSQVEQWNSKNHEPLAPSYVKGQLLWHLRQKESRLPPNFDKPHYKEIGITPTNEEITAKNPVSWVIRKGLSRDYAKNKKNVGDKYD